MHEFVGFLEEELKTGPPLLEALENADIFYETQYKEVKIVANVSVHSRGGVARAATCGAKVLLKCFVCFCYSQAT